MTKYIIDEYTEVYTDKVKNELVFYSYQSGKYKIYEFDNALVYLIKLVQKPQTKETLYSLLIKKYPDVKYDELLNAINTLIFDNIIRKSEFQKCTTDPRWARQKEFFLQFSNVQPLMKKKIAIIGIGGTGSWVAQTMALMGIGEMILIDPDKVELSNLNRQVLFSENDIGHKKTTIAKKKISKLNSQVKVIEINSIIEKSSNLNFLDNVDLVISCADFPSVEEVGQVISDYCYPREIPMIIGGGYNSHIGSIGISIIPTKVPCFRCYVRYRKNLIKKHERNFQSLYSAHHKRNLGSLAAIAGLVGNYIALEAVKILTTFSTPATLGKFVDFNFVSNQWLTQPTKKYTDCPICGKGVQF